MSELENLKKKILYRSNYRGTKELDLILSAFVQKYIKNLNKTELNDLNEFLNLEDEEIFNFLKSGQKNKNIKKNRITELIKNFKL